MSARCAVCELPIEKGERFALMGTEVLHRRCATSSSARNTVRTRLELRNIELTGQNREQRTAVKIAQTERDEARRQLADERERTRQAIKAREIKEGELQVARAARDAINRDGTYWRERAQTEEAERNRQRIELETLRAENVRLKAEVKPVTDAAKDDRDPSEVRFSLLEIDKP